MKKTKSRINESESVLFDNSFYRKCYLIALFFTNIAFIQIAAYVVVAFIFVWGVILVFYNEKKRRMFYELRFGLWIAVFIIFASITAICYITSNFFYNIIMIFHVSICFFIFYGMHTEKNKNHKSELYSICRFIVYATTILAILGLALLFSGFSIEIFWIKFIVYENRFTGLFVNPNLLGFASVCALFCCHLLTRKDFIRESGQNRVSSIWLAACTLTNLISLLLCDSNSSFVLLLCYIIFTIISLTIMREKEFKTKQFVEKCVAIALAGSIIIFSGFMIRTFCQTGFSIIMAQNKTTGEKKELTQEEINEITSNNVTFEHINKNIDSGRFELWRNSAKLFLRYPFLGTGKGNIVDFSQDHFENSFLQHNFNKNDLHNGYLTILISSGILGFAIFTIFGLRFAKHSIIQVYKNREELKNNTPICEICFLLAYLVYAFFEKALLYDISFMVMFFWFIMGSLSCTLIKYEKDDPPQKIYIQHRLNKHY